MKTVIGRFEYQGKIIFIVQSRYITNDRVAVALEDECGLPYAVLTANVPEIELESGEFLVKTWSENKEITSYIRTLDIFEDTKKRVPISDYVTAEVWRFKTNEQ